MCKSLYVAHYQLNTRFFRIFINSTYQFYIFEYKVITKKYNYSK
jgi:hypothetical protein